MPKNTNQKLVDDIKILRQKLGENWTDQIELLESLVSRKNLFFTFLDVKTQQVGTFGEDNIQNLAEYLLFLLQFQKPSDLRLIVFVRCFNFAVMKNNIPLKYISCCILTEKGVLPLSKEDVEESSTTDFQTGQKIEKEFQAIYMSFNDWLEKAKGEEKLILH